MRSISLHTIKRCLILLNFINILFCGSTVLLTSRYIMSKGLSRTFLSSVASLPRSPVFTFFVPIILYFIMLLIMHGHENHIHSSKCNFLYGIAQILICYAIIYTLYISYNGIILLVFASSISHVKDHKHMAIFLSILIFLLLLSNYDVISIQNPMVSLHDYIKVYDMPTRVALLAIKNILESLNLVVFIVYMIVFIVNQKAENDTIQKELSMLYRTNEGLRSYVTVTEKMAEDRERKRLAREIHDTLGHALTGIAAGVDASIALLDKSPKQTKEQLLLVSAVVRQGIGDVRASLHKMRPGALEGHTLRDATFHMVQQFSKITDIHVDIQYELENIDIDKTKEDTLFRIMQEAITNAKRHGEATYVTLHLYQKQQNLCLTIEDNGKGCTKIIKGFGLQQMKERISMLQGEIFYSGENGFRLQIKIPLQKGEQYD